MKKAVIIMAHQMPEQINIFIEQLLTDPEIDVFVHVSGKYSEIKSDLLHNERVFISDKNIVIHWGSDEFIRATLIMYKEVLNRAKNYEYVIVCTGQDLMVKNGLDDFLTQHNGELFVEIHDEPYMEKNNNTRVLYRWPEVYRRKYDNKYHPFRIMRSLRYRLIMKGIPLGKKKFSFDVSKLKIYYNYVWYAIPFDVMKYVSDFISENPQYMEIFTDGLYQSECFLATIILNESSPYKDKIEINDYRSKCLTYCKPMENSHPPVLKMSDIDEIEKSGCFFARKFDLRVDSEVVKYFKDKIVERRGNNK